MKKLFLLLFLFFISANIYSQAATPKTVDINERKSKYKTLKIITNGNEDNYYKAELIIYEQGVYKDTSQVKILLFNNDTLTKIFNRIDLIKHNFQIKITTATNSYDINKLSVYDFDKKDTIIYNLNYIELTYKEDEIAESIQIENRKEEQRIFKQKKLVEYKEILLMMKEAYENASIYEKKIKGKSRNKIADYLDQEGFDHEYYSGRHYGEKFTIHYRYGDLKYNEKSYDIIIYMYYSYGYGNLYYEINYNFYFKDWYLYPNDPYEFRYFDQKGILVKFNLEDFNEN